MESGPLADMQHPLREGEAGALPRVLQADVDWYRDLVDLSRDLLCVHDLEGRILSINPAPARLLGYSVEEIMRIPLRQLIPPEFQAGFDTYLEDIRRDREARGFLALITRFGKRRIWEYHNTLRTEGVSSPVVCGMAHDVTEQKQTEKALRAREAHFRLLIEQASDGIFVSDANGRYLEVNSAGAGLLGYSREEILNLTIAEVVAPEEIPRIRIEVDRLAGGKVVRADWTFRRKDGSLFPGEVAGRQLPDGRLQAIVRDISERKLAEKAVATIVKQVRGDTGEAFFSSMAYYLAECVSADYTIIGELIKDGPEAVKTLGVCRNGKIVDNFTYLLANSPCERLGTQGICSYSSGVAQAFPNDPLLTEMNVEAYVGTPLFGADGQPIGIMAALYCRPLDNAGLAEMILNLFSARTGAEIERNRTEETLRQTEALLREVNEELQQAKERLTEENLYLEQEIDSQLGVGQIVGNSAALKSVLDQVAVVASCDATVLLLGETGTGKELIARAVHHGSKRKDQPFIKMNCAAIPSGLLESELFGHEKGAFTGAVARKLGRLELADNGTLFLDEIAEIPLELQPKLLRVLQDQEFERLGSNQTLKVNFRLIAATNRDLLREVNEQRFRSDLYYRLNVFPIRTPPLRDRRSDIPALVEHFVHKHAQRMNKTILRIHKKTMDALMQWNWPGNVRELENFVERSVILSQGPVLAAPLGELAMEATTPRQTLELVERAHIVRVLEESRGQLSGATGAAARLGLPRTTLQSKLKKLRIDHRRYRTG